jgi:peptidyl-prolyl cis-trans isomerase D
MLTRIRDRASGWIAWAIVILISIPFALWGINSYFEGASKIVVATAEGIEIEQQLYQQALTQQQRTLVQLAGRDFDPEFFVSDVFKRQVVDQLIDETLQGEYIRSRRYRISDDELNRQIQAIPAFRIDGVFDNERYRDLVSRAGLSITGFEEQQRQRATFNQVESSIVATAFVLDSGTDTLLKLLRQERDARYVILDVANYWDQIVVTDDDIEIQYQENSDRYYLPSEIQVRYLILSVEALAADIVLDEQEIKRAYEENTDRFMQPESRSVRHILIGVDEDADEAAVEVARIKATELVSRARSGADFAALAEANSDDVGSARRGGDLGIIQPGTMPSSFEVAVATLAEAEISEPILTRYGFHVIQVTRLSEKRLQSYTDVRDRIASEIKRREAESRFVEMAEVLRNVTYEQPDSLEPAARALELEISESDWFSRDHGEDFAVHSIVREAAFSNEVLVDGLNSEVVEVNLDTLIVMRKANYRERSLQHLSVVRAKIIDDLRMQRGSSAVEGEGKSFINQLQNGSVLWSQWLIDHEWQDHALAMSDAEIDDPLLATVRLLVYAAPRPRERSRPVYGSGWIDDRRFVVYQLSAVMDGDPSAASTEERAQIQDLILRRDGAGLLANFQQGLRTAADVTIYPDQL